MHMNLRLNFVDHLQEEGGGGRRRCVVDLHEDLAGFVFGMPIYGAVLYILPGNLGVGRGISTSSGDYGSIIYHILHHLKSISPPRHVTWLLSCLGEVEFVKAHWSSAVVYSSLNIFPKT